jgi:hypothetical protein
VRLQNASNIRFRNVHVNAESGLGTCDENGCATRLRASKFPFENAIVDVTHRLEMREREFAVLDVPANPSAPPATTGVTKLAGDFYAAAGGVVDAQGKLYFVDHHSHRIHGWSEAEGLTVERDDPLDPVNLTIDRAGNLIVLSSYGRNGTVYAFKPGTPDTALTVIPPTPAAPHQGALTALPVNLWNNGEFKDQYDPRLTISPRWPRCSRAIWPSPRRRSMSRPTAVWCFRPSACSSRDRQTIVAGVLAIRWMPMGLSPHRPEAACSSAMSPRTRPIPVWWVRAAASPI